ncbi:MAG: biopolymer transporter ExbD [Deltaproteobacteria bacterium]|nr:biopolymer transporter ExbD [Deltaproteobacteria bacterium]
MAFKPSERMKNSEIGELNLMLNPMMDMFAVLIPALLMMSVVVEIAIVNVSAPSIGPSEGGAEKPPDKPPLNFTVTILETGYALSTTQGPIPGPDGSIDPKKATIPIIKTSVLCSKYRGTKPPPRTLNANQSICPQTHPMLRKEFYVYDTNALRQKAQEIKDQNPDEHRIIIGGSKEVEYEALIDVMDATRDFEQKSGEITTLFDEVVLSPGL